MEIKELAFNLTTIGGHYNSIQSTILTYYCCFPYSTIAVDFFQICCNGQKVFNFRKNTRNNTVIMALIHKHQQKTNCSLAKDTHK